MYIHTLLQIDYVQLGLDLRVIMYAHALLNVFLYIEEKVQSWLGDAPIIHKI